MVATGGWFIAKGTLLIPQKTLILILFPTAATVSIRYAHVRRQGNPSKFTGLEKQVIDYPSTYYRLLPILSHAYVFIRLGRQLVRPSTYTRPSTFIF